MSESLERKENQKNRDFKTGFIRCNCDEEVLVARYDKSTDSLELSIFESSSSLKYKLTWREKLRYIYYAIFKGQLYYDQIILDRTRIEEFKGFLKTI